VSVEQPSREKGTTTEVERGTWGRMLGGFDTTARESEGRLCSQPGITIDDDRDDGLRGDV